MNTQNVLTISDQFFFGGGTCTFLPFGPYECQIYIRLPQPSPSVAPWCQLHLPAIQLGLFFEAPQHRACHGAAQLWRCGVVLPPERWELTGFNAKMRT